MALAGLLSSVFGVLLEPIEAELGWSRAEISSGPFVVSIMGLFLAAPAGHLIDRWGSRRTGVLVIACTFLAILGMAIAGKQLWQWWAAWSVFGIAGAFTSTVWMAPVSTLFDKGRGMAIAVTIAGASVSSIAAPPIFAPGIVWITLGSLVFHALVGGLRMSAVIYMTSTYLGARSFGLFYGAITTTTTVTQGLGPLIANYIYDQTQSYQATIWAAVPGFLLTALCFAALGPKPDFARTT